MSKPRPDLSNETNTARDYVNWLGSLAQVESVYLAGSRSPLREKQPTETSDWDLVAFTKLERLKLPNPRTQFKFHCDLLVVHESKTDKYKKAVQLWPNDVQGILNG